MKKFIILLILILIVGSCCTRERCASYHYHRTFPAAFYGAAEYAVARWVNFSGNPLTIDPGDPDEEACSFRAIPKDSKEYRDLQSSRNPDFLAIHKGHDGSIIIVPDFWNAGDPWCVGRTEECARSILMHEIAHEFGMGHLEDPLAVMQWKSPPKAQDYNESDRQEWNRVESWKKELSQGSEVGGR